MVIVELMMRALPGKRIEILQTLMSRIDAIRQGKGCLSYNIYQSIEDENVFCLIKNWESREDLENHMRSDSFKVLLGLKFLLENERQEIQVHTISDTEGKEIVSAIRGNRI
ncbi:MAG: antibiotic biosynthesis monooxygenase [Desulfobacterales bacterium]